MFSSIIKKLKPFSSHIIITIFVLGFCLFYGLFTNSNISNFSSTDESFEIYTNELFIQEVSANTLNLHYTLDDYEAYGIIDPPITLGQYSTDSTETSINIENQMSLLSTFSYDELSLDNQLTYDVLQDYLTVAQTGTSYTLFYEPLSPYTGIHTQLPILLAEFSLDSEEDITTYLALLEVLPDYFTSLLSFEEAKSSEGLFMSDAQLDIVLEDCYAFVAMEENYLLSTFDTRISNISELTETQLAFYSEENSNLISTSVLPAYEDLIAGLKDLRNTGTNTQGLCYYENGRNYYAYLVRSNTGSSRTLPEIQVLIENQLLDDLVDLQESYQSIEDGETFSMPTIDGTCEEILASLESNMSNLFPDTASVSITVNEVPSELEPFLSPAFYLIPTIDNVYENTIYVNNAYMTDDVTLYTTLAHEGFPGHLYQTTYFASTSPDPLLNLFSYGGYLEGWATYAEMCSYYLGDMDSPEDAILQKNASLNLGLYAYADIGIHYEGWSLSETIAFFRTYGITDSETIIKIHNLIVATPSNYLKYYLGYLEFLELKKDCIEVWGEDFSQIRFHEAVLEVGPVSFDILRKYVIK